LIDRILARGLVVIIVALAVWAASSNEHGWVWFFVVPIVAISLLSRFTPKR
jgi:hypothetical protein